ncbi:MAG: hypothetical protein E7A34_00490 [Leclercia adecarboxylata]|nr:hypothetical protein [Leclercia adecarboxylata]MDU1082850.1 hypothetical protein [Leclercia adecarboxylata]
MATLDDNLANAITEGFRQAQIDIVNQDLILSGTGDVTVTLANGSKKTGPSWSKLITAANAAGTSAAAAEASAKNAKTSETNANASKNAAASSASAADTSKTNAKTSETNAKTSETNAKTSENNAGASASSAAASLAAAQQLTSVPYEEAPYPDVWAPLNDDLRLLAGFAPYDKLTISGQVLELPTKSLTFSRVTSATYIDKSGVLQTAAINEPRFERDGLLMEGANTNLFANSLSASWSVVNSTATPDTSILAPDKTQNGIVRLASAGGTNTQTGAAIPNPIANLTAGGFCAFSVFAKADTHNLIQLRWLAGTAGVTNRYLNVDLLTGEVGAHTLKYAEVVRMANGWWRILAVTPIDGSLTGNTSSEPGVELISALTDPRRPAVSLPSTAGVYLFGPQLESGAIASSYIPTSGASATRAADNLQLQASGNVGYGKSDDKVDKTTSLEVTVNQMGLTGTNYINVMSVSNSVNNDVFLRIDATKVFSYRGAAATLVNTNTQFSHKTYVQSIDRADNVTVYLDGVAATRVSPPVASQLEPSVMTFQGTSLSVHHIRNFRIWHRLLTANQIKGLR